MADKVVVPQPGDVVVDIAKGGENIAFITLGRSVRQAGLKVSVRVHPSLERFAQSLGNGTCKPVELEGKEWFSEKGEPPFRVEPIEIYQMDATHNNLGGNKFRMDMPGGKFEDENGKLNLSFLRIVGISKGPGVSFTMKSVYGLAKLNDFEDKIGAAITKLYQEYIKPIDFVVVVTTQEIPR